MSSLYIPRSFYNTLDSIINDRPKTIHVSHLIKLLERDFLVHTFIDNTKAIGELGRLTNFGIKTISFPNNHYCITFKGLWHVFLHKNGPPHRRYGEYDYTYSY